MKQLEGALPNTINNPLPRLSKKNSGLTGLKGNYALMLCFKISAFLSVILVLYFFCLFVPSVSDQPLKLSFWSFLRLHECRHLKCERVTKLSWSRISALLKLVVLIFSRTIRIYILVLLIITSRLHVVFSWLLMAEIFENSVSALGPVVFMFL